MNEYYRSGQVGELRLPTGVPIYIWRSGSYHNRKETGKSVHAACNQSGSLEAVQRTIEK